MRATRSRAASRAERRRELGDLIERALDEADAEVVRLDSRATAIEGTALAFLHGGGDGKRKPDELCWSFVLLADDLRRDCKRITEAVEALRAVCRGRRP